MKGPGGRRASEEVRSEVKKKEEKKYPSIPLNPPPSKKHPHTSTGGRRGGSWTTDHPERWRQTEMQT